MMGHSQARCYTQKSTQNTGGGFHCTCHRTNRPQHHHRATARHHRATKSRQFWFRLSLGPLRLAQDREVSLNPELQAAIMAGPEYE